MKEQGFKVNQRFFWRRKHNNYHFIALQKSQHDDLKFTFNVAISSSFLLTLFNDIWFRTKWPANPPSPLDSAARCERLGFLIPGRAGDIWWESKDPRQTSLEELAELIVSCAIPYLEPGDDLTLRDDWLVRLHTHRLRVRDSVLLAALLAEHGPREEVANAISVFKSERHRQEAEVLKLLHDRFDLDEFLP